MRRISIYQIQDGDKMLEAASRLDELINGKDSDNYIITEDKYGKLASHSWVTRQLKNHSSNVAKFSLMIVDQLPDEEEEIDPSAIYLVPNNKRNGRNLYTEYIWNSEAEDWEMVGSQALDLDGVLTEDAADKKYLGINSKAASAIIADSATVATTATVANSIKTIKMKTVSGIYSGTQISFDAKSDISISLPETISADITGNAVTADMAQGAMVALYASEAGMAESSVNVTPITLRVIDYEGINSGDPVTVKGGETVNLQMPETFNGDLTGNAATATSLKNKPRIYIDSSGTADESGIEFSGESDVTLKMPSLLDVTVTLAERATTDKNGNDIYDNYARTADLDLSYCTQQQRSDILEEIEKLQKRIKYLEDNIIIQKT